MSVSLKLDWSEGLKFSVEAADGRTIELNSAEQMGQAFKPMELFLAAMAGCTAMDIVWILERQRQKVDKFELSIRGVRRDQDPRYYETIDLEYRLAGNNLKRSAVERAIRLSHEKYCSVKAMVKDIVKINVSYKIADDKEPQEKFVLSTTPHI